MHLLPCVPPRGAALGFQLGLAAFALLGAFLVRFDGVPSSIPWPTVFAALAVVLPVRAILLIHFRLHRGMWWHVEVDDLLQIVRATSLGTLLIGFAILISRSREVSHLAALPVGVVALD